jgi:hypothetical protein
MFRARAHTDTQTHRHTDTHRHRHMHTDTQTHRHTHNAACTNTQTATNLCDKLNGRESERRRRVPEKLLDIRSRGVCHKVTPLVHNRNLRVSERYGQQCLANINDINAYDARRANVTSMTDKPARDTRSKHQ